MVIGTAGSFGSMDVFCGISRPSVFDPAVRQSAEILLTSTRAAEAGALYPTRNNCPGIIRLAGSSMFFVPRF